MTTDKELTEKLIKSISDKGIQKKGICERAGIAEATLETFTKIVDASEHELILRVKQEEL